MNYIAEINAFMDSQTIKRLSAGQQALWFALMHTANRCNWQEWLSIPCQTLQLYTGLSRKGIEKARNVLKQKGYIDFKSNGTKATSYRIIAKSTKDGTQDSIQVSSQDGARNSAAYINKTKQYKTKQAKESVKRKIFTPPAPDEVKAYCAERGNAVNAERFVDFYTSKGWKIGKEPMKDWKAAVRTWEQRDKKTAFTDYGQTGNYDLDGFEEKAIRRRMEALKNT